MCGVNPINTYIYIHVHIQQAVKSIKTEIEINLHTCTYFIVKYRKGIISCSFIFRERVIRTHSPAADRSNSRIYIEEIVTTKFTL